LTSATYAEQVYDHILTQIFNRELRPGDLLDRKQIARELDISLIPVSDAVQRLTHEGLLTTRRRQGTFVNSPSIEDVRGQLFLREAIECQSARLYCGSKINAARKKLLPLARAVDKAVAAGKPICSEDFSFHQALVALTECDALIRCFARIVTLSLFHEVALISPTRIATYDKHVELLSDLCQASPDEADARIRRNLRAGKALLFEEYSF
jgi:GntR family transcriptional regulator, rspAB operon transcriptional repressor